MTEKKKISLKEKIKEAQDLKFEIVRIDEWDVEIEIKAFSTRKRLEIGKMARAWGLSKPEKVEEFDLDFNLGMTFMGELLINSCFDPETKEPIFLKEDVSWLLDKSGPVIQRLVDKAMEVNGLEREAVVKAEKN